jgi:hypothetical protein
MQSRVGRQAVRDLPGGVLSVDQQNHGTDRARANAGKTEALFRDASIRASLALGHQRGRFLYEIRPDIFPQGFLTNAEIDLWDKYYHTLK